MKTSHSIYAQAAINTVFGYRTAVPIRRKLPKDYYKAAAPLSVEQWHLKMDQYRADHTRPGSRNSAPETLLDLTKKIVSLPFPDKVSCIDRVLDEAARPHRISLNQLLRLGHQILQLPPSSQIDLMRKLKTIAARALTTMSFVKDTGETLIKALGLDQPGPWADVIEKNGIFWRDEGLKPGTGTRLPSSLENPEGGAIKRRIDVLDNRKAKRPRNSAGLPKRKRTSALPGVPIEASPAPAAAAAAAAAIVLDVEPDALDSMLADFDAGLMAEWTRNFLNYRASAGSHSERRAALSTLINDIGNLSSKDHQICVEKIFDEINDGLPVQFEHAQQLCRYLDAIRKANPGVQIAPDFGRAVWQWASRSGWTADELSAASDMLHSTAR